MFYSMVDKCTMTQLQKFSIFGNKQVMWKYTLFLSTLPTRYMLYFVALMTVGAEIVIEKSGICGICAVVRIGIKFNLISIQKNIKLFAAIVR